MNTGQQDRDEGSKGYFLQLFQKGINNRRKAHHVSEEKFDIGRGIFQSTAYKKVGILEFGDVSLGLAYRVDDLTVTTSTYL